MNLWFWIWGITTLTSIIVIRNFIIKEERYEDAVANLANDVEVYEKQLEEIFNDIQSIIKTMKEIDNTGAFEADDMVGGVFSDLKRVILKLQKYSYQEKSE